MSNLIEQIMKMEEDSSIGYLILQPKNKWSNGQPKFDQADAIIRRMWTNGGRQWAFHTLSYSIHTNVYHKVTGSGVYGDVDDVVKAAERQYGIRSDIREWVPVEETYPDVPPNLKING